MLQHSVGAWRRSAAIKLIRIAHPYELEGRMLHLRYLHNSYDTLPLRKDDSLVVKKTALYTAGNSLQRSGVSDFSNEFVDEIGQMSGRCLDVGSGPGDAVVDFILPKFNEKASLVCSDISENMVNFAKEKYKDNERLSFMELDIQSPDLPGDLMEHFDHVTSTYCLHWCQDMRQAFRNIFDMLQPGGTTLLLCVAKYPAMDAYHTLAGMRRYQPYITNVDRYIPAFQHSEQPQKTLKALIKDVGFEVHHCTVREKTYIFDKLDGFRKFSLGIDPYIERIPADLIKEYEKDLVKEVAKRCIVFNKNNNDGGECSTLLHYFEFFVYLKKPPTK